MLKREFRTYTKKENRSFHQDRSKALSKTSTNSQNAQQYERLTFNEIQNITRLIMKDPKLHENNMGVISSIKGKMYCLKLGAVSSSKDFSNYFYFTQYRKRLQKVEPLRKLNTNELFNTTIQKF